MGIKGLNTFINASFPGVMDPVHGQASASYDHICFDLNGIVHNACRRRGSEKEVVRAVVAELDALLRLFPAQRTVFIALDGPGPTAKLVEQRKRRIDKVLKAARDAEALIPGSAENLRRLERCRLEGRPLPSANKRKKKPSYDSLQVTPGTLFMLRMRRALEWYAASRIVGLGNVFRQNRPCVIISASDVAGEGELKLLQHLHAVLREHPSGAPPPSFLLVGPDADLLLLGLAAGAPMCDVLTTDSEGAHRLFRVGALCEAFACTLGRSIPQAQDAVSGPVHLGGLVQLDFLVVAFLQGNDYLPKLRGAQLPRMWTALLKLLRSQEFDGQHLLVPHEDRVEINMVMLVRLARASCVRSSWNGDGGAGGDGGGEEEGEEEEEGDEDKEDETEGLRLETHAEERSCRGGPPSSIATSSCSDDAAFARPRARCDVEGYLHCLAWCACMYLCGRCPDYSCAYSAKVMPSTSSVHHAWSCFALAPSPAGLADGFG